MASLTPAWLVFQSDGTSIKIYLNNTPDALVMVRDGEDQDGIPIYKDVDITKPATQPKRVAVLRTNS